MSLSNGVKKGLWISGGQVGVALRRLAMVPYIRGRNAEVSGKKDLVVSNWHRFWTYNCNMPVTRKLNPDIPTKVEMDLLDLPKEVKAEDAKEMCQKADQ